MKVMENNQSKHSPQSKKGRIMRWLLGVGVIIVLGVLGTAMYRTHVVEATTSLFTSQTTDPVPTQLLKKTPFTLKLPAIGEIIGLETVPVPTPVVRGGGLKIAWLIPEGTFVQEGDLLMRFDNTDMQLKLDSEVNTLESTGKRIDVKQNTVKTDSVVLEMDQKNAEWEYDYAVNSMPEDEDIFSKWEIIEAKINAGVAKERMSFLSSKQRVSKRTARADMQILNISKNKSLSEIDIAKNALAAMELRSPKSGLALYKRDMRKDPQIGDSCWPGQVIVEIVDLSSLQAKLWILETDAAGLTKDLPVEIRMDAIPEHSFHGTIRQVAAIAQVLETNSPLKYFECQALVKTEIEDLKKVRPGMSLKADVITHQYDAVFVVANSSVETKDGKSRVYVKKGKEFEVREVKIGSKNHGQSAIVEGLQENDVLALRNPFETRKVTLPDFSKGSMQQGMSGPRVMMRMH